MGNHSYLTRSAQVLAGALIGVALCCPWTATADQGTIGDSAVPSAATELLNLFLVPAGSAL